MFFVLNLKLAYQYKAVFYFTISLLSPFEAEHSLPSKMLCRKLDHDIG